MTKRVIVYLLGLFILALGVNISKIAGLGISPVSSVPYALELVWGIEMGQGTWIVNFAIMGLQILLLRKNYKLRNLLQAPCVLFIGTFITLTGSKYLLFWLPMPGNYAIQLAYCLISIVVIGIGVSLFIIPNVMPLPPEGFMQAIVEVSHDRFKFGNVKICVDSCLVLVSGILSLVFLGQLKSVREGTVLAALLVGKVVNHIFKHYKQPLLDWFDKGEPEKIEEAI